jgi:hypothetical protein
MVRKKKKEKKRTIKGYGSAATKTTIYIPTAVVEADSIDYTRPISLADNAM